MISWRSRTSRRSRSSSKLRRPTRICSQWSRARATWMSTMKSKLSSPSTPPPLPNKSFSINLWSKCSRWNRASLLSISSSNSGTALRFKSKKLKSSVSSTAKSCDARTPSPEASILNRYIRFKKGQNHSSRLLQLQESLEKEKQLRDNDFNSLNKEKKQANKVINLLIGLIIGVIFRFLLSYFQASQTHNNIHQDVWWIIFKHWIGLTVNQFISF